MSGEAGSMSGRSGADRRRLAATVAGAADAVVSVLAAHPMRGSGPYPAGDVLAVLLGQQRILLEAVDGWEGPLAVTADGRPEPLAGELALFMSYLQLSCVLYRGLSDIPASMRADAARHLSTIHLAARRLRDRARRAARAA
jgi:hypothetical protein